MLHGSHLKVLFRSSSEFEPIKLLLYISLLAFVEINFLVKSNYQKEKKTNPFLTLWNSYLTFFMFVLYLTWLWLYTEKGPKVVNDDAFMKKDSL